MSTYSFDSGKASPCEPLPPPSLVHEAHHRALKYRGPRPQLLALVLLALYARADGQVSKRVGHGELASAALAVERPLRPSVPLLDLHLRCQAYWADDVE